MKSATYKCGPLLSTDIKFHICYHYMIQVEHCKIREYKVDNNANIAFCVFEKTSIGQIRNVHGMEWSGYFKIERTARGQQSHSSIAKTRTTLIALIAGNEGIALARQREATSLTQIKLFYSFIYCAAFH